MKNMIIILIAILALTLANCEKEPKAALVGTHMEIKYLDKLGNNLLDPKLPNHYSADSIKVYNFVNRIKKEVYHALYQSPRNFHIYNNETNENMLMLYYETDTTLLQLNYKTIDTISWLTERSNGNWLLKKFWYNGELKWDDIMLPQKIVITK